ncbi:unnamed protein product [Phaeothamnion confervicola]
MRGWWVRVLTFGFGFRLVALELAAVPLCRGLRDQSLFFVGSRGLRRKARDFLLIPCLTGPSFLPLVRVTVQQSNAILLMLCPLRFSGAVFFGHGTVSFPIARSKPSALPALPPCCSAAPSAIRRLRGTPPYSHNTETRF